MKKYNWVPSSFYCLSFFAVLLSATACKKLGGLPLQENAPYNYSVLNPNVNMTVWQYIKSRAIDQDSIFYRMYQGIVYSGIDTMEYTLPGRSYILYNNDAVFSISATNGSTSTSSYFGKYKVKVKSSKGADSLITGKKWEDYPKEQIKNHLLSLIVPGYYTFETLNNYPKWTNTLLPVNSDTFNTKSRISFSVTNDRAASLYVNSFPNSAVPSVGSTVLGIKAITGGILATNGPMHVFGKVVYYQEQMTAWDMIKDRGPNADSLYYLMYKAIQYSGIDTAEYLSLGRTFLLYTNDAIYRKSGDTVAGDCYFGKYKINGQAATSWDQYDPLQVKNHLLSLIVQGERTIAADTVTRRYYETSLMPVGYDSLNPKSEVVVYVRSKVIRINDFPGSKVPKANLKSPGIGVRTPGTASLNGPVHVLDRVVFYQK